MGVGDVREGGTWSRRQRAKNDVLRLGIEALLVSLRLFPRWALRILGEFVGLVAYVLLGKERSTARENIERAFPSMSRRDCKKLAISTYRTLGRTLGDTVHALSRPHATRTLPFAPGSREVLVAAHDEGRGVVLASAHLGPWEQVAASLATTVPLKVIARAPYDPRLKKLYDRLRGGHGVEAIYRGSPGASTAILRTLRRGGVLGIPMDLASRVPSIAVPFLGSTASTPVGPARLVLRARAALVVATVAPTGRIDEPLEIAVTRIASDDLLPGDDAERVLTTRINDELAKRIRALPERWVWMHPRWSSA